LNLHFTLNTDEESEEILNTKARKLENTKKSIFDRIYRIFRIVFSQFPDETEKGFIQ